MDRKENYRVYARPSNRAIVYEFINIKNNCLKYTCQ